MAPPEDNAQRIERERAAEAERLQREAAAKAAADREAALDALEAKHAAVHAEAIAVVNIKVLIPITLDRAANNYDRWRKLFLVILGKYALTDHVLSDAAYPERSAWVQMDCTVLTWIYGTITADLQQQVMLRDPSARVAWAVLDNEFLGQRESRALVLSAEFRSFKQGALSITNYCRRLETMASALAEFGDPVGDRILVLTLLRGLNGKFKPMVSNLRLQRPFPMFDQARTHLLLEELDINDTTTDDVPPTLYVAPSFGGSSGGSGAPSGGAQGGS